MARKSERPSREGCPKSPAGLFFGGHQWEYSMSWNGNDRTILPFDDYANGISRAGWRCSHCGKFAWDQSDREFALCYAESMGFIKLPPPL